MCSTDKMAKTQIVINADANDVIMLATKLIKQTLAILSLPITVSFIKVRDIHYVVIRKELLRCFIITLSITSRRIWEIKLYHFISVVFIMCSFLSIKRQKQLNCYYIYCIP